MPESEARQGIARMPTGIAGLDQVLGGGAPAGRAILVAGESGTGKTVLLNEFLYRGMTQFNEPGLFVTCEEPAEDIRRNVAGFGWDYAELEAAGKLAIADISPSASDMVTVENESYSFEPLLNIIGGLVESLHARRIAIDNLANLFLRYQSESAVRQLFHQLTLRLKERGLTSMISAERSVGGESLLSKRGLEEFVADGVIELTQTPGRHRYNRWLRIRKLRGVNYQTAQMQFVITERGMEVFPPIPLEKPLSKSKPAARQAFGIPKLDAMIEGGLPAGHIALFSGNTGTGKSAFALHFTATGLAAGDACVYVTLEEPGAQLIQNAEQFGWPFAEAQRKGRLVFLEVPMSDVRTDQLLYQIVNLVRQTGARRLIIDSLSGLERAIPQREELRDFLEQLVRFCKMEEITSVMTYAAPAVFGATRGQLMATVSVTEAQLSSIVDAIFLLRFVEQEQGVINLLNVLKVRSSAHDRHIYEYSITKQGVVIGEPMMPISPQ